MLVARPIEPPETPSIFSLTIRSPPLDSEPVRARWFPANSLLRALVPLSLSFRFRKSSLPRARRYWKASQTLSRCSFVTRGRTPHFEPDCLVAKLGSPIRPLLLTRVVRASVSPLSRCSAAADSLPLVVAAGRHILERLARSRTARRWGDKQPSKPQLEISSCEKSEGQLIFAALGQRLATGIEKPEQMVRSARLLLRGRLLSEA